MLFPFILSYLFCLYLIFSRSYDQDDELGFIRIDYLQLRAPMQTHRGICHDFHRFSSFSTLSPRRSHSFHSTMTCFSYLILSYLPFSLSYLSGHMMKTVTKTFILPRSCLQFRTIPQITTRTSRSVDPFSGNVPPGQELPVPPNRLHHIQLLPGEHLREGLLCRNGNPNSIGPPTPPSSSSLVKSTCWGGATAATWDETKAILASIISIQVNKPWMVHLSCRCRSLNSLFSSQRVA